MRQIFRHSLAVNFSIFCGLVAFACSVMVTIFFLLYQQKSHQSQSRLYGETVLENLVQAIELAGHDRKWLQAYVVAVGTSPGILQVHLIDGNGKTLAHSNPARLEIPSRDFLEQDPLTSSEHLLLEDETTHKKFIRIRHPLEFFYGSGNEKGFAFLDVSLSNNMFFLVPGYDWAWFFLSLLLVALVGIGFIFFFLERRVIQVALSLQTGAASIARGDFGKRIAIHSHDELGEVASSFNQMAEILGENVVSRKFFNNILSSMAESLIVLDARKNITMVNKATIDLTGYSQEELLGKQIGYLLRDGQDPDPKKTLKKMFSGSLDTIGMEAVYVVKNDWRIPVLFSAAPLKSADGDLEGVVCIARDIVERKIHEHQLTSVNSELMETNKELKKTQAQLVQSAKLASLGEMAAGVAHELNQPLHVINMSAGLAELFLTKGDKDQVQDKLEGIVNQVKRATTIINHLRIFGRKSHNEDNAVYDFNQIINDTFGFFGDQFRLHDIELAVHLESDLPKIFCNPIEIEQVVSNLLRNAKDAVDKTLLKKITVRSFSGQDKVMLELSDTGVGIEAEDLENIFDPFFTTKRIGKGTGLGLSISYGIINEHGGTIEVESEKGQGTLFRIILPAYPGE